jgi:NAD-dependent histone deacetylase SIR2
MFAVYPKLDCPHVNDEQIREAMNEFDESKFKSPCQQCSSTAENWLCFHCKDTFCSRFVEGHLAEHYEVTKHPVAFSFTDGSAWCYECDSYVYSRSIKFFAAKFEEVKFGNEKANETKELPSPAVPEMKSDLLDESIPFPYEQFIKGLKEKQFKQVAILTGAGISVAAGIPDFRTPEIGLYAKVAKFNLPYPEAVFSLEFFKDNPYPFYQVAREFLMYQPKPVAAHYFIKKLNDEGQLFMNYTQNIDGLELDAGLPADKLIQAHGHMRSARCLDCSKEYSDMKEFMKCLEEERLWLCSDCNPEVEGALKEELNSGAEDERNFKGLVKPDIVFFGEALPKIFHSSFETIRHADLVIVMGTSLKVFPFAFLVSCISDDVPVVLINRENPGIERNHLLFLPGDIQENIVKIAKDLNWNIVPN